MWQDVSIAFQYLRSRDADAESLQPDVMAFARGHQLDGGDAEIAQDLRAEPDFDAAQADALAAVIAIAMRDSA